MELKEKIEIFESAVVDAGLLAECLLKTLRYEEFEEARGTENVYLATLLNEKIGEIRDLF